MEKKLALALVLVALACGALWWALRGTGGARGADPEAAHEPATSAEETPAPATLAPAPAPTKSERTTAPMRERPSPELVREHETFSLDGAVWLDVTVLVPAGAPREDEPALIGFARKDHAAYESIEDVGMELGLDDSFTTAVEGENEWARRALAPHLRLPFPAESKEGLLFVQSRYLHLDALRIDLTRTSTLTLKPELGGWLTGRCTFPADARVRATEVELGFVHPPREGAMSDAPADPHKVRVAPDLSFELRALSAKKPYLAFAGAEGFVPYNETIEVAPGEHRELTIAFRTGAAVSGVVRGEGRPLEGVEVEAHQDEVLPWSEAPSTRTDADGAFRLSGLPDGEVTLAAKKDGWRDGESEPLTLVEGQELRGIEIALDAGARISGRVQWPDGSPAVGASVEAMLPEDGWLQEAVHTKSDATGAFQLGGLEEKALDVFAECSARDGASGSWHALQRGVEPGASGIVLVLQPSLPVQGIVTDDTGAPVTRFEVEARPTDQPLNFSDEVHEGPLGNADGSFTLEVAHAGEWVFYASDVEGRRKSEPVTLTVPQGAAALRLVLPRASAIGGRVLDPLGKPVAGAALLVSDDAQGTALGLPGDERGQSGDDGRFALDDVKMPCTVQASHADWAPSEPVALALAPGERQDDLELVLHLGARITGEVLDAEGRPEAGQNVNCMSGSMGLMTLGMNGGTSTRSDAAGRFVFEHVAPGKVTVTAIPSKDELMAKLGSNAEGEAEFLEMLSTLRTATVELADGGEVHVVLGARPKRPVRVHGRVTQASRPLAGKTVIAMAEGGALLQGMKQVETGADGRYELELDRPGDYVFVASLRENSNSMGVTFYVEVPAAADFELDLALPLGRLAGVVLGPEGPASSVALRLVDGAGGLGMDDLSESHNALSASDGSFAFEGLGAGSYALHVGSEFRDASPPRFGQVVVDGLRVEENRATEGVVVHLEPFGTLAGIVRDAAGRPVAGAGIFVRDAAGRAISATSCTSDAAGRYGYLGVAPGRVSASARTATLAGAESAPVEVRAGATTTLDLVVASGTVLRVTLLAGGEAVRARFLVVDEAGRRVDELFSMEDFGRLFSEGVSTRERRVGPLAPGKYTLTATALDGKQAQKALRVEGGEGELRVELRLE